MDLQTYRDPAGRFLPGNRYSTAEHNPLCRQVTALKTAFTNCYDGDTMRSLAQRLLELCRDSDPRVSLQAIDLLFNRLWGKPKEQYQLDVSGTDHRPPPIVLSPDEARVIETVLTRTEAALTDQAGGPPSV